jgi:N-acetylglucosamine transport system substrate-binding protein
MKTFAPLFLVALGIALVGCGGPDRSQSTDNSSQSGSASDVTLGPAAPTGDKPSGQIEVQAFNGGFGIDFYTTTAAAFDKANGTKTTVDGDPRIWEKLRPRMIAGTPPDLMFPGWGFDHFAAGEEGQLMTLDAALDSPSAGGSGTWRSTFEPDLLKLGQLDGKQIALPYYFNVWGVWYDPGVFSKHGWTPPKTYEDLLALCEKIKAAGIAPLTFQGKYPYYMLQGMYLPWVQDIGGIQAVNDMQNLKPGAWNSPAALKAAEMIKELQTKGYFETGAVGLSHTESQTDFLNGKAAMIPCGTWLDSEMKKTMPAGASIRFMLPPAPTGTGDPTAIESDIEPWMVPTKAKNANGAIALFKYMTSLPVAESFVKQKAGLMSIKGANHIAGLPASLVEPSAAFDASKTKWSFEARYWYTDFEKEVENALTELCGTGTPQQFCDRCEKAAQKVANDSSVTKHKV